MPCFPPFYCTLSGIPEGCTNFYNRNRRSKTFSR
ncbi:hypothetical protein Patl1_37648 [Pistacia atlantica]|nr:hypothetical protein Patl1_37648 [Pistacia atlantica]